MGLHGITVRFRMQTDENKTANPVRQVYTHPAHDSIPISSTGPDI